MKVDQAKLERYQDVAGQIEEMYRAANVSSFLVDALEIFVCLEQRLGIIVGA